MMFRYNRRCLATLFLLAAPAVVSGAHADQPIPLRPPPYQGFNLRPIQEGVPQPVKDGVVAFQNACAGWAAVDDPAYNDRRSLTPAFLRAQDQCRLVERPDTFMWTDMTVGACVAITALIFAAMLIGALRVMVFGWSTRPSFPLVGAAMRGRAAS